MRNPIGPLSISKLPAIKFDGEYRVLGCIPSNNNHNFPDFSSQVFGQAQNELREIDLSLVFNNRILNQGSTSSCASQACAAGFEFVWRQIGNLKQDFTPYFIYALINNGQDAGAMISDGLTAMKKYGACPNGMLPQGVMFSNQLTQEQMNAAARFKLSMAFKCNNYDEVCQAINIGFSTPLGIMVGDDFANVDDNGIAPLYRRGGGGHAILGVGLKYHPTYGWLIKFQNSWGCYDKETEILTENGWKKFSELGEEKVATLNQKTHELEYQKPSEKQVYDFDGKMLHHVSRDIDLLVTPNHNMYVRKTYDKKLHGVNPLAWSISRADETPKIVSFKKNATWNEGKEEEIKTIGEKTIPMDLWLEFLGYFISEGHTCKRIGKSKEFIRTRTRTNKNSTVTYTVVEKSKAVTNSTIGISQTKECNLEKIDRCLSKMPFKFKKHGEVWTTNSQSLFEELSVLGKAGEKGIPSYVRNLSVRQQTILFDALMLGDGSYSTALNGSERATYYTSSPQLADDVQELVLKIGYAGDISVIDRVGRFNGRCVTRLKEYHVRIKRKQLEQRVDYSPKEEDYKDKVYCVTVPNHVIYVRRNGKAVWCGNSNFGINGYAYLRREHFNLMAADAFAIQAAFDDPQDATPDDNIPVVI